MKFEKRSGDEAETPSSAPEETPSTGKKPVVIYIMILFIVAFLLMALSFLMHQRSNSEVIGELQDSVTAMQVYRPRRTPCWTCKTSWMKPRPPSTRWSPPQGN